eukprot:CAMPEP_0185847448 /NCGR_PEP_ID=MMETSP1354-20130828/2719_1 /TAXON_ID=708628 /ORGANISM="Erythrolobus madagascarensis, Strain CCMP3276" /LENGTH=374 /DNA_ID=CAMNT_0028547743 /DNA_START=179 /DNA_END=1303 /DNA_ORIENTATION=+
MVKSGHLASELFEGNSRFWCHGKALTGPDYTNAIITLIAILIAHGLYYGICIAWLCTFWQPYGFIILALALPLSLTSLISFTLAVTDDPGIIPRAHSAPPEISSDPSFPRELPTSLNNTPIKLKYCETCRHWRPPRCVHCFQCNNCVERMDHHCPWLGNCVGRRNYRSFFVFVSSTALLCVYVMATIVLQLTLNTRRFLSLNADDAEYSTAEAFASALGFWGSGVLLVVFVFVLLAFGFTGGLTGFHLFLMWRNVTTNEFIKKTYGKRNELNPYEERGVGAWSERLMARKTHSKLKREYDGRKTDVDVDALVEEGVRRLKEAEDKNKAVEIRVELPSEDCLKRSDDHEAAANGKLEDVAVETMNGGGGAEDDKV